MNFFKSKVFFVLVFLSFLATIVPVFFTINRIGGIEAWQGVLPKGTTDSLYYYARMHEVLDGHYFIGHPYLYEHRNSFSPAFFLSDVISVVPMLFGLSFNLGVVLNIFIWSFVFLVACYKLLRFFGLSVKASIFWSLISFVASYSFVLRPTVMQVIYPIFLFFMLAFCQFLREPQVKKRIIYLSLVSALSFYCYTFLAYIIFLTLAFAVAFFAVRKNWYVVRSFILVACWTLIFIIPIIIYTLFQINSPYYFETFDRIGLVYTHLPAVEAFYYGRWLVIGLLAYFFIKKIQAPDDQKNIEKTIFLSAISFGLLISSFLNVFTGVEMTLAVHIGRFVFSFMPLMFGLIAHDLSLSMKANNRNFKNINFLIAVLLILVLFIGIFKSLHRGIEFFNFDNRGEKTIKSQNLAKPLSWLDKNVLNESVVWANESISRYVPIMTKHYVLFNQSAVLHNVSSKELEDRYLLSKSFSNVGIEDLKNDFPLYVGAGAGKLKPLSENQKVTFCKIKRFLNLAKECPQMVDPTTLIGEKYFIDLKNRFEVIEKNQKYFIKQFNVQYLIIEKERDEFDISALKNRKVLYEDEKFIIYYLGD